MIQDLRSILDGWEYEPGRISVRKIIGRDQREKIQARVDLGLMQFETLGRPDGEKPFGCDLLLTHHERRLNDHVRKNATDEGFELSPEECRDLRREAYLLHQRFVALFVLEEYDGVERDTASTLRIIDMCMSHAATAQDRDAMRDYRNYVHMMYTRGLALLAASRGEHERALGLVEEGIAWLREQESDSPDHVGRPASGEIGLLEDLRRDVLRRMPNDARPKLEAQLAEAIAAEDYEAAAKLRDRLSGSSS